MTLIMSDHHRDRSDRGGERDRDRDRDRDLRNRIYVGKLHYDVRTKDLERFFKDYGRVNDINIKSGYAFVVSISSLISFVIILFLTTDFDDHRDADDAVYDLDGRELLGERVLVEHCKGGRPERRDDRRGGGGGGGPRMRSIVARHNLRSVIFLVARPKNLNRGVKKQRECAIFKMAVLWKSDLFLGMRCNPLMRASPQRAFVKGPAAFAKLVSGPRESSVQCPQSPHQYPCSASGRIGIALLIWTDIETVWELGTEVEPGGGRGHSALPLQQRLFAKPHVCKLINYDLIMSDHHRDRSDRGGERDRDRDRDRDLRNRIYVGKLHYDVRTKDLERFFKDYGRVNDINIKSGYAFVVSISSLISFVIILFLTTDFDDHRDADDAVYDLDGRELLGERVLVEHCKGGRPERRDDRRGGGGGGGPRMRSRTSLTNWGDLQLWLMQLWLIESMSHSCMHLWLIDSMSHSCMSHSCRQFDRPFNTKYRVVVEGISSSCDWRDLKDFFRRVADVTFADAHRFRPGEGVADFRTREEMKRAVRELDDTKLNGRRVRVFEDKPKSRSPSPRRSRRSRSNSGKRDSRSRSRDRRSRDRRSRSRTPEDNKRDEDKKEEDEKKEGGGDEVVDEVGDRTRLYIRFSCTTITMSLDDIDPMIAHCSTDSPPLGPLPGEEDQPIRKVSSIADLLPTVKFHPSSTRRSSSELYLQGPSKSDPDRPLQTILQVEKFVNRLHAGPRSISWPKRQISVLQYQLMSEGMTPAKMKRLIAEIKMDERLYFQNFHDSMHYPAIMQYSRTPIYRDARGKGFCPVNWAPGISGFDCTNAWPRRRRKSAKTEMVQLEVSWYRILVKSRICGSDMLYPDIPGTPIYRAKWLPPRIPVNRGPTVIVTCLSLSQPLHTDLSIILHLLPRGPKKTQGTLAFFSPRILISITLIFWHNICMGTHSRNPEFQPSGPPITEQPTYVDLLYNQPSTVPQACGTVTKLKSKVFFKDITVSRKGQFGTTICVLPYYMFTLCFFCVCMHNLCSTYLFISNQNQIKSISLTPPQTPQHTPMATKVLLEDQDDPTPAITTSTDQQDTDERDQLEVVEKIKSSGGSSHTSSGIMGDMDDFFEGKYFKRLNLEDELDKALYESGRQTHTLFALPETAQHRAVHNIFSDLSLVIAYTTHRRWFVPYTAGIPIIMSLALGYLQKGGRRISKAFGSGKPETPVPNRRRDLNQAGRAPTLQEIIIQTKYDRYRAQDPLKQKTPIKTVVARVPRDAVTEKRCQLFSIVITVISLIGVLLFAMTNPSWSIVQRADNYKGLCRFDKVVPSHGYGRIECTSERSISIGPQFTGMVGPGECITPHDLCRCTVM
eukprot:sb/3461024/